jgi:WhiB family redox-sensing transcriptional regulator
VITADALDWQERAMCGPEDDGLFFGPDGEGEQARREREAKAKAVCAVCPSRLLCLEYALDASPVQGVWGGLSEDERRVVLRERPTPFPSVPEHRLRCMNGHIRTKANTRDLPGGKVRCKDCEHELYLKGKEVAA